MSLAWGSSRATRRCFRRGHDSDVSLREEFKEQEVGNSNCGRLGAGWGLKVRTRGEKWGGHGGEDGS